MRLNKKIFDKIVTYLNSFPEGSAYLEDMKSYKTWELRIKKDFIAKHTIFDGLDSNGNRPLESHTKTLKDIFVSDRLFEPIKAGTIIDDVMSLRGGLMPATNILIYGDAGLGKTTIWLDILCGIVRKNPDRKVLYISSEMDEFDMYEYKERIEGLDNIEILFLNEYIENRPASHFNNILNEGYDVVLIDSLAETIGILSDDLNKTIKKTESYIVDVIRTHNKGSNKRNVHTTFGLIQQVTKGGNFVGTNKLKHNTTATMELRLDKEGQYLFFSKNRRGRCFDKLYYAFTNEGIKYDERKYREDIAIKNMKSRSFDTLANDMKEFENAFEMELN